MNNFDSDDDDDDDDDGDEPLYLSHTIKGKTNEEERRKRALRAVGFNKWDTIDYRLRIVHVIDVTTIYKIFLFFEW